MYNMTFLYDLEEAPIQNATRYISYVLQTIQNHPEDTPIDRIEEDLQKIVRMLGKCKTIR